MKCIAKVTKDNGEIISYEDVKKVTDAQAQSLVKAGYDYISKTIYKENVK